MSVISLETAKAVLDVIHTADDAKLQTLLDGAEDEAVQFMNRGLLQPYPAEELVDGALVVPPLDKPPASMVLGVLLLLQAAYQATPDDAEKLRRAAEIKLQPFRIGLGV